MLTVEDFEKIRKAVLVEGLSERQATRKFRHSRKTIKKALKHSVPPGYKSVIRQQVLLCWHRASLDVLNFYNTFLFSGFDGGEGDSGGHDGIINSADDRAGSFDLINEKIDCVSMTFVRLSCEYKTGIVCVSGLFAGSLFLFKPSRKSALCTDTDLKSLLCSSSKKVQEKVKALMP